MAGKAINSYMVKKRMPAKNIIILVVVVVGLILGTLLALTKTRFNPWATEWAMVGD
jgi:LPS O-antigen subunit length determinant protein (WzzB/FepE family)